MMTLRRSQARASSLSRPARQPPPPYTQGAVSRLVSALAELGRLVSALAERRCAITPPPPPAHTQGCRGRARRGPLLRGVLAPHLPLLLVFPAATSSPAATSPPAGPPARRPAGSFPHRADFPPARLLASKLHPRDADRRTEQASVHPRDADRRIEQASVGSTEQPHFVSAAGLAGTLPPYAGCAGPPPQGAHCAGPPHARGLVSPQGAYCAATGCPSPAARGLLPGPAAAVLRRSVLARRRRLRRRLWKQRTAGLSRPSLPHHPGLQLRRRQP